MGPFPLTVTTHSTAMSVCNLFPNLVPCDSEFYFYPALNQRESICYQSGCHHVKCYVGRVAECPAAQIRPIVQTKFSDRVSYTPHYAHGMERQGARKAQIQIILAKMESEGYQG